MKRSLPPVLFALLLLAVPALVAPASAQPLEPRFGAAFNGMITTTGGVLGLGVRGRVSAPVNTDLSFALDIGLTGFVLRGRDDATYVFDPQVSAIVTLPSSRGRDRAPYFLGGLGAYVAFNDEETEGGPSIHGGIGYVQSLQETTIFYEFDPAIIIGEKAIDVAIPIRVGVIF